MNSSVQELLHSFDLLPEAEQRELAWEILRRTVSFDLPALSEEEIVLSAEELFLELDRREAQPHEHSYTEEKYGWSILGWRQKFGLVSSSVFPRSTKTAL